MEGSAAIHGTSVSAAEKADQIGTLFCFSHLRWDFVFQRPQHLMTRLARRMRVVFWEEPRVVANLAEPQLALRTCAQSGVTVAVPELPDGLDAAATTEACRKLLQATNVTVSTSEHAYAREVSTLVRDAYLGLDVSIAQEQRAHGSMHELLRQYIDLLNVLNPTAAPGWIAESLGRGA